MHTGGGGVASPEALLSVEPMTSRASCTTMVAGVATQERGDGVVCWLRWPGKSPRFICLRLDPGPGTRASLDCFYRGGLCGWTVIRPADAASWKGD